MRVRNCMCKRVKDIKSTMLSGLISTFQWPSLLFSLAQRARASAHQGCSAACQPPLSKEWTVHLAVLSLHLDSKGWICCTFHRYFSFFLHYISLSACTDADGLDIKVHGAVHSCKKLACAAVTFLTRGSHSHVGRCVELMVVLFYSLLNVHHSFKFQK